MSDDIYRQLQERLDLYSFGFPATASGVEIKILKKLFSEADAQMFLALTLKLETPESVADRLGLLPDEVADKLSDMAGRGLLFCRKQDDVALYGAIPYAHGLFEFQVDRLDAEFAGLAKEYEKSELHDAMLHSASHFLRPIPIQQSIDVRQIIAPYEDARAILESKDKIVVADCICRKANAALDEGCGKPLDVCFMFGTMGQYYLDNNMGRQVDVEEALALLRKAHEAGLVTQPATSQNPTGMCNCCGDCCAVLATLNKHPRPVELVLTNYYAEIPNEDLCTACEACVDRCQMNAVTMRDDNIAEINLDRCIGCGLCVTTCPADAISLKPKPAAERQVPPTNSREQIMGMAEKRGTLAKLAKLAG